MRLKGKLGNGSLIGHPELMNGIETWSFKGVEGNSMFGN